MKYLVEIILEDGVTPFYNYYNTIIGAMQDIGKMKGVVSVNVFELNSSKSAQVLYEVNGKEKGGML